MFLGRETLENHSQLPKKANKCSIGAIVSFSYVRRHRHVRVIPTRESTDSLIYKKSIADIQHVLVKVPARVLYGNYWARGKFEKVM